MNTCVECNENEGKIIWKDGTFHCLDCEIEAFKLRANGLTPKEFLEAIKQGKIDKYSGPNHALTYNAKFLLV
jgi:hypothetical protein